MVPVILYERLENDCNFINLTLFDIIDLVMSIFNGKGSSGSKRKEAWELQNKRILKSEYYEKNIVDDTVLVPKRHKKLWNFHDNNFFEKYGFSVFKRRPNYVPNVSRTYFRFWCTRWHLVTIEIQKCDFLNNQERYEHMVLFCLKVLF